MFASKTENYEGRNGSHKVFVFSYSKNHEY